MLFVSLASNQYTIKCKIIQRENGNFKNLDRRNLASGLKLLFG